MTKPTPVSEKLSLAPVSRCVYCSSKNYGRGCAHGPKGVHFHPSDPKKCSYCGSKNYGKGCRINPFGNVHVHGPTYNQMFTEASFVVEHQAIAATLLSLLQLDFKDWACYKQGFIDEHGNKLRSAETPEDSAIFSPLTELLVKIKRAAGVRVDLIAESARLKADSVSVANVEDFKKMEHHKQAISAAVAELYEKVGEAVSDGVPLEVCLLAYSNDKYSNDNV